MAKGGAKRLGILSDTHNEVTRTRLAVQLLRDAGAEALAVLPAWFVFGNHDADMVPSLQRAAAEFGPVCLGGWGVVDLGGKRVGVAHGHMTTDVPRVLAEQPEFLLSGHSHFPRDVVVGGMRRINPGALHRADEFTVAVLELASGELQLSRVAW